MKKYGNGWKVAGTILSTLGGFLYWHEVGCLTGHCPIQSHWQTMTLWGGVMGFLMTDLLQQMLRNRLNRPEKSEK